jgi:hypothetical protein
MRHTHKLLLLMMMYGAASLLHFMHNALYIQEYPNLPRWITPLGVYASWCGIALLGALGFWLYRMVSAAVGRIVIAVYALLGFAGLDHYVIAPFGAHSIAMNATIIAEVSTATVLLVFLACELLREPRPSSGAAAAAYSQQKRHTAEGQH